MCDVSIIVPVFNTGQDLERAISSILLQRSVSYEVICVNDGSDDDTTIKILDELRNKTGIQVLDLAINHGAGYARNIGLDSASGEYVIFLDSDDVYDANMLSNMLIKIKNENADVCLCNSKWVDGDGNVFLQNSSAIDKKYEDWIMRFSYEPWTKLVLRKTIVDNNIKFQEISSSNDIYYSFSILSVARNVTVFDEYPMVTHFLGKTTQISSNHDARNIYYVGEKICNEYHEKGLVTISDIALFLIIGIAREYKWCRNDKQKEECYELVKSFIISNEKNIIFSNYYHSYLLRNIIKNSYESGWLEEALSENCKLESWLPIIVSKMEKFNNVVLWGAGNRGKIFLGILKRKNIRIRAITDIRLDLQKVETITDIMIIQPDEAIKYADCIIASNKEIRDYVIERGFSKYIINLEDYLLGNIDILES